MDNENNGCIGHPVTNLLMGAQGSAPASVIDLGAVRAGLAERAAGIEPDDAGELPPELEELIDEGRKVLLRVATEFDEVAERGKRIEAKLDRLLTALGEQGTAA